jgi:small subunit ribosomal protein S17
MRIKKGTVTSDKMDKTIVVTVHAYKTHAKYKKKFRVSTKLYADDPSNKFKIGDEVTIYETTPLSKLKRWTVNKPETQIDKA